MRRAAAVFLPTAVLVKTFAFPERLTIAWDLDGTLITHKRGDVVGADHVFDKRFSLYLRPGAPSVLRLLSVGNDQHLFTAATRPYADSIVDALLPPNVFTRRLYREDLVATNSHGKDLARLGAPLSHTLLIDDQTRNRVGAQHFLLVEPFKYGDANDVTLWIVAAMVLAFNCAGPRAFDGLRWLAPNRPSPLLLAAVPSKPDPSKPLPILLAAPPMAVAAAKEPCLK